MNARPRVANVSDASSASAYEEVVEQDNDGHYDEDMNEATSNMEGQPAEQPEDDEDNDDYPENSA